MILGTGARLSDNASETIMESHLPLIVLGILLLCLCVSSWGACVSTSYNYRYYGGLTCSTGGCSGMDNFCSTGTMRSKKFNAVFGGVYYADCSPTLCKVGSSYSSCASAGCVTTGSVVSTHGTCNLRCDSQADLDSIYCANNPDAEGCANACTADQQDCESRGGVWEGSVTSDTTCTSTCDLCNTAEALFIKDWFYNSCCEGGLTPNYSCGFTGIPIGDGMVYSDVISPGCNTASWETNEICNAYFSSSSEATSSSSSETTSSSSSVSEYCLLFPDDLACICAADSTNPACAYLNSSSSEGSQVGSSGSSDGSSGSGGGDGGEGSSGSGASGGSPDDWEYDYRDSLHRIIRATTRTASIADSIERNTEGIWLILKQAKCLFVDCTDYDSLAAAFVDSSIVIPDGDTAGIIAGMEAIWDTSIMVPFLSGSDSGNIYGIDGDSVDYALGEMGEMLDSAFSDSGGIAGELDGFREIVEDNFPTSQWSYTSSCPTALTADVTFNIPPIGEVNAGRGIGDFFCGPLPPFDFTLGNMIRAVIRLAITIFMAMGIFRTATGFKDE